MLIDRRQLLGLLAASTATALAGCGGGGDSGVPTRDVWLLNLHPDFGSADLSYGRDLVAAGLPFGALTPPIEIEFGVYSVGIRDRASGRQFIFDGIGVDDASPPVDVFYRYRGTSAHLGAAPLGIVNYFDSPVALTAEVIDAFGSRQQIATLAFEASIAQVSRSSDCRLRLYSSQTGAAVYDSGLRRRADAIIAFPADSTGLVGVVGLNYNPRDISAEVWLNTL